MRRRDFIVVLGAVAFRSAARAPTQIVGYLNSGSHNPASSAWVGGEVEAAGYRGRA